MASKYAPDEIASLIKNLFVEFQDQSGQEISCDVVTEQQLKDDATVDTKRLPAVFILFTGVDWTPKRDITRVTYGTTLSFSAMIGYRNLRNEGAEQLGALKLVNLVADKLAGSRFVMQDGVTTEPIELVDAVLLEMDKDGTWYQLNFTIGGIAQFTQK